MTKPKKKTPSKLEIDHALEIGKLKEKHFQEITSKNNEIFHLQSAAATELSKHKLALSAQKMNLEAFFREQKTKMQKMIDELEESLRRQVHKYEDENVRRLDMLIERNGAIAKGDHFERQLKTQMRAVLESGFRRSQTDPNFAVVRSLINTGQDLHKVDFMALGKEHPEATIFGLVMVAEELGYHLKMDVKLREAVEKSKPAMWNVNWTLDTIPVMIAAMDAAVPQPTGVPPKKD